VKREAAIDTHPEQPARKTNRMAMVSFICGIGIIIPVVCMVVDISIAAAETFVYLGLMITYFALLLGLIGLVSGVIALWQIKKKAGREKGKEKAIAGIVLGILVSLPALYIFITTISIFFE
jgi:uncharacterized protein YqgC (DUF456 family)